MTDLTKEELIKLAEIAGKKLFTYEGSLHISQPDGPIGLGVHCMNEWNPAESIAQAMEVLKGYMQSSYVDGPEICFSAMYHDAPILGFWLNSSEPHGPVDSSSDGWELDKMFCECICKAVLKASEEG